MIITFIDASNAFQTNVIEDPQKRVYVSLPMRYLEWFQEWFPDHLISKHKDPKQIALKSLRNIQWSKDAGFEWYQLLAQIFLDLGWKANTTCKGVGST